MKKSRNLQKLKQKPKNISKDSLLSRWLPVFLWAGVIFYFSSQPQIQASQFFYADFFVKKIAHISEYAILFFLVFRATKQKWILTFIIVMLYAVSDEFHQSLVPGRTPRVYDVFGFDLSGAMISAYIIWKLQQLHLPKLSK